MTRRPKARDARERRAGTLRATRVLAFGQVQRFSNQEPERCKPPTPEPDESETSVLLPASVRYLLVVCPE